MGTANALSRPPVCGQCDRRMERQGKRVTADGTVREAYQCDGCEKLVISDVAY